MKSKDPAFQLGYFYGENTLLLFWDLRSVTLWIRRSCLIFFFFFFNICLNLHFLPHKMGQW